MPVYVKKKKKTGGGSFEEMDVNFSELKREQTSQLVQIKAGIFQWALGNSSGGKVKGAESRCGTAEEPLGGHGCGGLQLGQMDTWRGLCVHSAHSTVQGFLWARVTSPRTLAPLQNGDMEGINWD